MVRQNLVVVTGPAWRLCRRGAVVAQIAAGAVASPTDNKGTSRCRYINSLLNGVTINPLMSDTHAWRMKKRHAATQNFSYRSSHRAASILPVLVF